VNADEPQAADRPTRGIAQALGTGAAMLKILLVASDELDLLMKVRVFLDRFIRTKFHVLHPEHNGNTVRLWVRISHPAYRPQGTYEVVVLQPEN
jgi:hypothetical protein